MAPEKEGIVKTFLWNDLRNIDLPQIDAVTHLAGKAHDTRNKSAADVYFKVNTGLTQRIFDWYLFNESVNNIYIFLYSKECFRQSGRKVPHRRMCSHSRRSLWRE